MSDMRPVVVYGASGFSARLIIEFLREYGVPFIAAGRNREKMEEVLAHVPGIGTADYEIVQVDHDVDELSSLLEGARVVCNTVGPCIYHASTVAEAALKAGCHYIDTGGETPWVKLAKEEWGERFAWRGVAPRPGECAHVGGRGRLRSDRDGTRAGDRLARDPHHVQGLPHLRVDADDLRPAPVGVALPRAERVQRMAAGDDTQGDNPERDRDPARPALGRVPSSGVVQGSPADRERARLRRPARPLDNGGHRRGAAGISGEDPAPAARAAARGPWPASPTRFRRASRRGRTAASSARSTSSSGAAGSRPSG